VTAFGVAVEVLSYDRDLDGDLSNERVVGVIEGGAFAPGGSTEDTDRKAQVVDTATLYAPAGSPSVTAQNKLRFPGGVVWEVDGTPSPWASPLTGWDPGFEIRITRARG
jgi:hypothetical protein